MKRMLPTGNGTADAVEYQYQQYAISRAESQIPRPTKLRCERRLCHVSVCFVVSRPAGPSARLECLHTHHATSERAPSACRRISRGGGGCSSPHDVGDNAEGVHWIVAPGRLNSRLPCRDVVLHCDRIQRQAAPPQAGAPTSSRWVCRDRLTETSSPAAPDHTD